MSPPLERLGEAARHGRLLSLLPQRDDDELAARPVVETHEHEPAVAHVHRPALSGGAGRGEGGWATHVGADVGGGALRGGGVARWGREGVSEGASRDAASARTAT